MTKRTALIATLAAAAAIVAIAFATGGGGSDGKAAATDAAPEEAVEDSPAEEAPTHLAFGWETDFSKRSVSFDEIASGGPPKDGIPAIDEPTFVAVDAVDFLEDREPVIALEIGGQARAYPIQILMWHEIVNDRLGGEPISVTFCPLCNTAIVFDRRLDGVVLDFGTTGNLRNSDLVMYDRQTETWWQQFSGAGIIGTHTGRKLTQVAARLISWKEFRTTHPDADVLSRDTGYARDYGRNPYTGYDDIDSPPFFSVDNADDDRLPPKERVVFLEVGDESAVVPHSALSEKREIEVMLGGRTFVVRWSPGVASALDSGSISDGRDVGAVEVLEQGKAVPFHEPFWFAVAAFRPDAQIVR
jgi:hypothetical protein